MEEGTQQKELREQNELQKLIHYHHPRARPVVDQTGFITRLPTRVITVPMATPRIVKFLDEFHEKRNEDGPEWLTTYIRISVANGWDDTKKLTIVPLYLKGIASRWFDDWEANHAMVGWIGAANSFVTAFQTRFQSEYQLNQYEE